MYIVLTIFFVLLQNLLVNSRLVPCLTSIALAMTIFYFARKCYQRLKDRKKASNILPLVEQNQPQPNSQFNTQAYNPEVMSFRIYFLIFIIASLVLLSIYFIIPNVEHKNEIFPLIPPLIHAIIFPLAMFSFNSKFRKFVFEDCVIVNTIKDQFS